MDVSVERSGECFGTTVNDDDDVGIVKIDGRNAKKDVVGVGVWSFAVATTTAAAVVEMVDSTGWW